MLYYRNRPGPGIEKNSPSPRGPVHFLHILMRERKGLIKVSCLFVLFSLPVVTIPAALCAMTRITLAMVRDVHYYPWHDFWDSFRKEFRRSTAAGCLLAGANLFTASAAVYYFQAAFSAPWFFPAAFFAGIAWVCVLVAGHTVFPMIVLVDLPLPAVLKNAALLTGPCFLHGLISCLVCAMLLAAAVLLFPLSILPVLLIFPGLLSLTTVFAVYGRIQRYVIDAHCKGE